MRLTRSLRIHPALFNVVPLLNVLFLVVAFFALSSRFVLQPGLAITLPVAGFSMGPQRDAKIVSVTAAPVPSIYFGDQKVTVDELRKQLAENRSKERSLIVKADRGTPYDLVVQITNEGLQLGFSVILATTPEQP